MITRIALFLAAFLLASTAHAQRCGDDARAWVERCASSSGVPMELESCPPSVAIVSTKELRIEISTSPGAFEHAGPYGISPIGQFADWKLEPEPRRRALQAVVRCVEVEPPRRLLSDQGTAPSALAGPRTRAPWLLLAGAALALVGCVRRSRATALAIGAVLATFIVRHWLLPFSFFHQNGQGPLWVEFAFRGDASEYGPGYPEIFGWASHVRRPERGIAFLQEALAATVPLSTYAIARSSRATRLTASILAAALALDPVLLRVARSESYFSTIAALIFAAAAILATTDLRHRAIGVSAAALLVAQAARVHPLAWVPCVCVPLVLYCRPGRVIDRTRRVAVAAGIIAVVALPLVYRVLHDVLRGGLGGSFMPGVRALVTSRGVGAALFLVPFVALAIVRTTRQIGTRALVLGLVLSVAALSDILAGDARVVRAAHLHLFLPAALAAIASVRLRWACLGFAALAIGHLAMERRQIILPTDARELDWALQWREQLPAGAEVAALGRVQHRMLSLPLLGEGLPTWRPIDEEGRAHYETSSSASRFYYRSSLCSTPEGAPLCARFENEHRLRLVSARRFPSIASLPWEPLPPGEIEVGLYTVE